MKRRRHNPEQIIRKLREADRMLAEGTEVPELAKATRGLRGDLSPLASDLRRHEGRRGQAPGRIGDPAFPRVSGRSGPQPALPALGGHSNERSQVRARKGWPA